MTARGEGKVESLSLSSFSYIYFPLSWKRRLAQNDRARLSNGHRLPSSFVSYNDLYLFVSVVLDTPYLEYSFSLSFSFFFLNLCYFLAVISSSLFSRSVADRNSPLM